MSLQQVPCNFSYESVAVTMSGIVLINSGNEEHLQVAIVYTGPVAAAIDARTTGFRVSNMQQKMP